MSVAISSENDSVALPVACPDCGRLRMRRLPRESLLQRRFWPLLGYYPWECPVCRKLRMMRHRGGNDREREP